MTDRALRPGNSYTEEDLTNCFVRTTGISTEEAALVRIEMLMRGELVLEPGKTDNDARFRRVMRLP
jgi:hypothetical protein